MSRDEPLAGRSSRHGRRCPRRSGRAASGPRRGGSIRAISRFTWATVASTSLRGGDFERPRTSIWPRIAVSGVRSSCDASETNSRCRANASSSRSSMWLNDSASWCTSRRPARASGRRGRPRPPHWRPPAMRRSGDEMRAAAIKRDEQRGGDRERAGDQEGLREALLGPIDRRERLSDRDRRRRRAVGQQALASAARRRRRPRGGRSRGRAGASRIALASPASRRRSAADSSDLPGARRPRSSGSLVAIPAPGTSTTNRREDGPKAGSEAIERRARRTVRGASARAGGRSVGPQASPPRWRGRARSDREPATRFPYRPSRTSPRPLPPRWHRSRRQAGCEARFDEASRSGAQTLVLNR